VKRLIWGAVAIAGFAAPASAKALDVLATVGMLGDVAANVAGDCAAVETLMGPGTDPHLFQPSAQDVQRFQNADVILYSGYGLEGQLGSVLGRLSDLKPTVAVSERAVPAETVLSDDGAYGVDPHIWMDAGLWAQTVPVIAETLSENVPDCAADVGARAQAYGAQLQALDGWIEEAIASVPQEQRILVTAHDAFGYYGEAYGIEVVGIQGISTASEASVADIRDMADLLVARAVPAVFVESTINPRTIQAVIEAAEQRGHTVSIGGELYSDAMGDPGTAGGTYIGMLYDNTVTIVEALGGTVPTLPEALGAWGQQWDLQ
jgi:manganese/zinc/iron transport system substrate-binding protein